ncbi:MAG: 4-hydroxybenzoate octaprenyltransferase, partial [Pseudomonadota bacterium]
EKPVVDVEYQKPLPIERRQRRPADAIRLPGWDELPDRARPYLSLSRIDRPVGIWLLALPCWIGLAFARIPDGLQWIDLWWAILFGVGSVAMRGAGCTWNDITDKDLDAGVARTAGRPLPAGEIGMRQAYVWLVIQLAVGFLVWLCLPGAAKLVSLAALPLVIAYPFMKRITWWPQAWLGLTFNWGVLVAAATVGVFGFATLVLYASLALWTIAYDTIYALEDQEDDALVGVRSTARLFGDRAITAAFGFHLAATTHMAFATYLFGAGRIGAITALAFLGHGVWQSTRLKSSRNSDALLVFKSNVWAGLIILIGCVLMASL